MACFVLPVAQLVTVSVFETIRGLTPLSLGPFPLKECANIKGGCALHHYALVANEKLVQSGPVRFFNLVT